MFFLLRDKTFLNLSHDNLDWHAVSISELKLIHTISSRKEEFEWRDEKSGNAWTFRVDHPSHPSYFWPILPLRDDDDQCASGNHSLVSLLLLTVGKNKPFSSQIKAIGSNPKESNFFDHFLLLCTVTVVETKLGILLTSHAWLGFSFLTSFPRVIPSLSGVDNLNSSTTFLLQQQSWWRWRRRN